MHSRLPRILFVSFALPLFSLVLTRSASAQTIITWVGSGDGDWSNAANWDLNRAPGFMDNVVNPTGFTTTLNTYAEIGSFTSAGIFNLSGFLKGAPVGTRKLRVDNEMFHNGRIEWMDIEGTANTLMHLSGGSTFDSVTFLGTTRTSGGTATLDNYNEIRGSVQSGDSEWVLWRGNNLGIAAGGTFYGTGVVRDFAIPDRNNPRPGFVINNGTIRAEGGFLVLGDFNRGLGGMSGEGVWSATTGSELILRRTSLTGTGQGARLLEEGGMITLDGDSALYGTFRNAEAFVNGGLLNASFSNANFDFSTTGTNRIVDSTFNGPTELTGFFAQVTGVNKLNGETKVGMGELLFANSGSSTLEIASTGTLVGSVLLRTTGFAPSTLVNDGVVRAENGNLSVQLQNSAGEGNWEAGPGGTLDLYGTVSGTGQGARFLNKGGQVRVWNQVNGHFREAEMRSEGATFDASFDKAEITGLARIRNGYFNGPTKIANQSIFQVLGTMVVNGDATVESGTQITLFDEAKLNIGPNGSLVGNGTVIRNSVRTYFKSEGEVRSSGGNLFIGTYNNEISGLTQADAGTTLNFNGPLTQTGGVTRAIGQIWMQNGIDLNAGRLEGGQVFGLGTIRNNGGTIAPGVGVGTMTTLFGVEFGSASTLEIDIQNVGSFDQLRVGTDAMLNGTLSVLGAPSSDFAYGTRFRILNTVGFVYDRFAVVPDPAQWTVHYGLNYVELEAVPEPSTVIALGLGGLALLRRRKSRA